MLQVSDHFLFGQTIFLRPLTFGACLCSLSSVTHTLYMSIPFLLVLFHSFVDIKYIKYVSDILVFYSVDTRATFYTILKGFVSVDCVAFSNILVLINGSLRRNRAEAATVFR